MNDQQNKPEAPRLLVVGGNGFIGRHVVQHAVQLGWAVSSLALRAGADESLSGVRRIVADIGSGASIKTALGGVAFEYVINCGGYIDHTLFIKGGRRVFGPHFEGVLNLVEALDRDALKAFVNIGSSDEYGSAPAPQTEVLREMPISPYALAKVAASHFLQMLYRTENFPAIILRPFLIYGPGQLEQRFLPQIIKGCLEGRTFPVSAGFQLRDFCFIQDAVAAFFSALEKPAARGEVINIGTGEPISIRHMVEMVQHLVGQGEPRFGEIAYRPGENMALYADIAKARSILGWNPAVTLESGLRQTIAWIKSCP